MDEFALMASRLASDIFSDRTISDPALPSLLTWRPDLGQWRECGRTPTAPCDNCGFGAEATRRLKVQIKAEKAGRRGTSQYYFASMAILVTPMTNRLVTISSNS